MFVWRVERRRRNFADGKAAVDFDREAVVARMLVGKRLRGVVPVLQVGCGSGATTTTTTTQLTRKLRLLVC